MMGRGINRRRFSAMVVTLAASRPIPGLLHPTSVQAADGSAVDGSFFSPPVRGVAMGDPLGAREGRPISDYAVIASEWHAGCVRLSVHPGLFRDRRDRMVERLDEDVRAALDAGLRVVIDWHAIGWPDGRAQQPGEGWGLPDDLYDCNLALAHDFWRFAADRYAGQPRIAFETWNEPVQLSRASPFARAGIDWTALRPIWTELIARIRGKADNTILASGGSWAADLTGVADRPLEGRSIGYAWHVYPDTGGGTTAGLDGLLGDAAGRVPIFVTEWGFAPEGQHYGTSEEFALPFLRNYLDRYAMSWTAWCWHPSWSPTLIENDWQTPTLAGDLVRGALAERRTR